MVPWTVRDMLGADQSFSLFVSLTTTIKALIYNICQCWWCKYSYHSGFHPANIMPLTPSWKETCRGRKGCVWSAGGGPGQPQHTGSNARAEGLLFCGRPPDSLCNGLSSLHQPIPFFIHSLSNYTLSTYEVPYIILYSHLIEISLTPCKQWHL